METLTLNNYEHLEIAKGILLKAIALRAEVNDEGAAWQLAAKDAATHHRHSAASCLWCDALQARSAIEDIAIALDGIGPLMSACKWDELIRRSTVLISQAKGGMR